MNTAVTRGYGLLEGFLAWRRHKKASKLIDNSARDARILDIGCGSRPAFMEQLDAHEKIGIDQIVDEEKKIRWSAKGINLVKQDLDANPLLPFKDASFDIVTMLAVLEHLERATANTVVREIHRVLKPGGIFVATTPARWANPILTMMNFLGLVSCEEVEEHQVMYTSPMLRASILQGGFRATQVEMGTFECGMNLWVRTCKLMTHEQ